MPVAKDQIIMAKGRWSIIKDSGGFLVELQKNKSYNSNFPQAFAM